MTRRVGTSLLAGLLIGGCALSRDAPEPPEAPAELAAQGLAEATTRAAPSPEAAPAPSFGGRDIGGLADKADAKATSRPRRVKGRGSAGVGSGEGGGEADAKGAPARPKPARMVHYNGFLKLRVTNPTQTLQQAAEIADRAGGYVEQLTSTTVTLRVPVARFRATYDELAAIGDVLSRSMSAQDVTDAFMAMDLRVKTLRASRDRLIALLGKAQKTREKLALLREIQRLTEEIDQLEMHLSTIVALAELSRLTVEAVPHDLEVESSAEEPIAAFRWIRDLSPFKRDVARAGDTLDLGVPEGMVELDRDHYTAESADGAVIWASRRDNEPEGTTEYWIEAIRDRLAPEYASAEVSNVGPFAVLRLVDQSEKAYRYLVAVRVKDAELQIIEVYFPSADHETRYGAAVRAVIEGGEK